MDNGLLQSLIEEDSGYRKEGKNWGRSEEHSSLVVNEESQRWYWNSENVGGSVLDYLILVRGLDKKSAQKIVDLRSRIINGSFLEKEEEKFYLPMEKLVDLLWELGKGNREYWYDRKIKDGTIDRNRLGFYNGWHLVPLYDGDRFVNFQMRRDKPRKSIRLWYNVENWEPVLINQGILSLIDTVFITEGSVDSILLNQEGIPSVASSSGGVSWSPKWYPQFSRVKNVYYIADNDKTGKYAALRVANSLGASRVKIFQFRDKPLTYDSGDYFKDGGNSKDFREMVESESKYIFEIGEANGNYKRRGKNSYRGSFATR